MQRTLQELRVHQIELELQNEELRRTRDELEDSREKYFDLYDLAPVGYATLSPEGTVLEANLTLANRLGITRAVLIGRPLSRFVDPVSASAYTLYLRRVFTTGEPESIEVGFKAEGGGPTWARIDAAVHGDGRNGTRTCRMALIDVSDHKRAEEALFAAHKLDSLGVLAGGIAHDFNNVLFAIRGNTALAAADLPEEHPVRRYVAEIDKAARRAVGLVEQILSFASPRSPSRSVIQLGPVVEESLRFLRAALPATIEFGTEWGKNLPPIAIDAGQVQQIIVAVVTNSSHAIGLRKGRIDLKLEEARLGERDASLLAGLVPGRYVVLTVKDNGCGMDRATLERAFDPFFTTRVTGGGTGLGLSIVHGLMKGHSGAAVVSSEVGRGTIFRLYFPATEELPPAITEVRPAARRSRSERILIVDDEEAIVLLVPDILTRLGYRPTALADPREALTLFRKAPDAFDALVTDVSMPGMSGFELAREVLAIRPGLPVIVTSGYVRPEYEQEAAGIGVAEIIRKPDTVDQLAEALDRIFTKS
jgi:PAS domain S-box-containing protein